MAEVVSISWCLILAQNIVYSAGKAMYMEDNRKGAFHIIIGYVNVSYRYLKYHYININYFSASCRVIGPTK